MPNVINGNLGNQQPTQPHGRALWMPIVCALGIYALAILVIDPIREFAVADDWSYAHIARTLEQTGVYQLDTWAITDMPLQAYWGALFIRLFGFSFAALRLSTLVLVMCGLIAFYFLCLAHNLSPKLSAILVLTLAGCQQLLFFSFSFNTDMPFLACCLMSLACYTYALKSGNFWLALAGSASAAMGILIRQSGLLIVGSFGLAWLLWADRRKTIPFLLAGISLAAPAAIWSVAAIVLKQSWIKLWVGLEQTAYLTSITTLGPDLLWRLSATLAYSAYFVPPLAALALLRLPFMLKASPDNPPNVRRTMTRWLVGLLTLMLGMSLYGMFNMGRLGVMPFLPYTAEQLLWPPAFLLSRTALTMLAGSIFGYFAVQRFGASLIRPVIPPYQRLLDIFALLMSLIMFAFFHMTDRYLFTLIPFFLIIAARFMQGHLDRALPLAAALSLASLISSGLWVRSMNEHAEAMWRAAEAVREAGVSPDQISASFEWNSYYGSFTEYLAENNADPSVGILEYMRTWLPDRRTRSIYWIASDSHWAANAGWQLVATHQYEDLWLRQQNVYTLRRDESTDP